MIAKIEASSTDWDNDAPASPGIASVPIHLVVVASVGTARPAALDLARRLNLPFAEFDAPTIGLRLLQSDTQLSLHDSSSGARLCVKFDAAQIRGFRSQRDPLRRAIGPGANDVVDATAGLGGDTVHLVAAGYRVTAIERNPIVSALACDGLARARAQGLLDTENPRWLVGDACSLLRQLDAQPATIYLDPMFPPKRKKSAAVRKEMSLLRRLGVGDDGATDLLEVARERATYRVVVKRPIDAPPLAGGVTATYAGRLVRFDVYRPKGATP